MDVLLTALGILLLLIGIIGCILPLIPGPPIAFFGMLMLVFTRYVSPEYLTNYKNLLWIFALVTIIVTVLDYVVPVWGTKQFGGTRAGTWGAAAGVVIGMIFFGPLGIILGPFLGAFLAELISGRDEKSSLRAGFGSFIGFILGVGLKLSATFLMTYYFFRELAR
ncbi:MAG: DUF456 domain-containing protein [Bacteroidales bacterium]|nr:DUF456 domain-containing protein [Bacteroidales bacterium]MCB9012852.1 DUF456 domain-containing protein [Bacteroidales bacterium]